MSDCNLNQAKENSRRFVSFDWFRYWDSLFIICPPPVEEIHIVVATQADVILDEISEFTDILRATYPIADWVLLGCSKTVNQEESGVEWWVVQVIYKAVHRELFNTAVKSGKYNVFGGNK